MNLPKTFHKAAASFWIYWEMSQQRLQEITQRLYSKNGKLSTMQKIEDENRRFFFFSKLQTKSVLEGECAYLCMKTCYEMTGSRFYQWWASASASK